MADLLTHVAAAYVPSRFVVRDPRVRALACLGACLPDVLTRAGFFVVVPGGTTLHDVLHTPAAAALTSLAIALLVERTLRAKAFAALVFGGLTHLAVDAGKMSFDTGGVMWGFPFTRARWEWGLYVPEHTVYLMAPALLAILLAFALGRRLDARRDASRERRYPEGLDAG